MSHSLRIALFHNLPSGGGKRAMYEWTRRLSERHSIDVYSLSSADHAYCDIRPFASNHYVWEFTPRRLFHSPFGRLDQLQRWRDLNTLSDLGKRIAKEINRIPYDIVFLHPCLYTNTPTLIEHLRLTSLYYLHEPFGPLNQRKFQRPYQRENTYRKILNRIDPLIPLYQHRLESIHQRCVRKITRLVANSNYTAECMKRQYGVNSSVSPLGVGSDNFHVIPGSTKQNTVISIGQLSPRKGFDFLIESIAHIPVDERPLLKLVCNTVKAGEPQYLLERQYIIDLAEYLGVSLNILTNLNVEQMTQEYNQARLCVYAPIAEPFGLVPLEALACGTPVVGVAEGGVMESVQHEYTGLLTPRNNKLFAEAIRSLLADPIRCEQYGRNGREHVIKNWSWDASSKAIENNLLETAGKA